MNVLIACEESQVVCTAFRNKGHNAFSCDIQECSGGHPEWHIKGDVKRIINGASDDYYCETGFYTQDDKFHVLPWKWDLIIAHPPCTDLCSSGAAWFQKKREDGSQRKSIEFFASFINANCDKVVIENPVGIISGDYILTYFPDLAKKYNLPMKPTQIIHPWMFGDNHEKTTCLWEKGVPPLVPLITVKPELDYFEWTDTKTGKQKRQPKWCADAFKLKAKDRARVRSKTFPGIAQAMADQWG